MTRPLQASILLPVILGVNLLAAAGNTCGAEIAIDDPLKMAVEQAGENRPQIEAAWQQVPEPQRDAMQFLIANMPVRDLTSLSADFLLENVDLAHRAVDQARWREKIPPEIFFNDILPYACLNETRDAWRRDFFERFRSLVADCGTPGAAAAILNQKIFDLVNVHYSTSRPKADQSPIESMAAGKASCTGLSILLVDACRAVGIPARIAGTPLWTDKSGNHTWVEVWDGAWHFTGAAEPAGDALDQAWFVDRTAKADENDPRHAIYASSYRRTGLSFPLVWARGNGDVPAVNVTSRYTAIAPVVPAGHRHVRFRVRSADGRRVQADLHLVDTEGETVFSGKTRDDRFDTNDHLTTVLPDQQRYRAKAQVDQRLGTAEFRVEHDDQLISIELD